MKDRAEEVLSFILGYRDLIKLFNSDIVYPDVLKEWPDMAQDLLQLKHYISHQSNCFDTWLEKLRDPANVPTQEERLKAYILGMVERNRLIWKGQDMKDRLSFAEDETVLDYGAGGCFYADHFARIAREVFAYDKPATADWVKDNMTLFPKIEIISSLNHIPLNPTVIWISEVFHGDGEEDIRKQISVLTEHGLLALKPLIVINELRSDTVLGKRFNTHMEFLTDKGRLYNPDDIKRIVGFTSVEFYKESKYHYQLGGRI